MALTRKGWHMMARVAVFWLVVISVAGSQEFGTQEAFKAFQDAGRNMAESNEAWIKAKKLGLVEPPKEPHDNCLDPSSLASNATGYLDMWPYSILDIVGPKDLLLSIPNPKFPPLWLTDYPTTELADGDKVRIIGKVEVVGTKSYDTVTGASNTVRVIKFVTPEREKQLAAEESAKLDTYLTRTWVDSTGNYKTLGKFLDFKNGQANIERKPDGKHISVPLSRLSDVDQKWIRDELKRRKQARD